MKKINDLIDKIKYEYLEEFSFILLLFWAISPVVEYFFSKFIPIFNKVYFSFIIYIIGALGILEYIIYFIKQKRDGKINKKKFLCEILILILILLGIISSIFSKNPKLSFLGDNYRKEGLIVYIMYVGFILSSSIIKSDGYKKNLLKVIIFSALIITILPLFKSNFTYVNFTNVFRNPNHYGYYLMITLTISIFMFIGNDKYKKIFYLLIYIFLLYILIRNDTFGCFLSISISLIILFIYSLIKKYRRISVISSIIIFVLVSFLVSHYDIKIGERLHFDDTSGIIIKNISRLFNDTDTIINDGLKATEKTDLVGSCRGFLWRNAIDYTLSHPIIGGGMESLNEYYQSLNFFHNDRPHNIILQVAAFIGIPGAITYISLILTLAFNNLKNIKTNSINIMIYFTAMTYFISSIFGNSMYYTSPYFMILLGLLIGLYRDNIKIKEKIKYY